MVLSSFHTDQFTIVRLKFNPHQLFNILELYCKTTFIIHIYIYIYVRVCVYVCVCVEVPVIWALETVPKNLENKLKELENRETITTITLY